MLCQVLINELTQRRFENERLRMDNAHLILAAKDAGGDNHTLKNTVAASQADRAELQARLRRAESEVKRWQEQLGKMSMGTIRRHREERCVLMSPTCHCHRSHDCHLVITTTTTTSCAIFLTTATAITIDYYTTTAAATAATTDITTHVFRPSQPSIATNPYSPPTLAPSSAFSPDFSLPRLPRLFLPTGTQG